LRRRLAFPPRDHYDILRALDYFRDAGIRPDARVGEAVKVVGFAGLTERNPSLPAS